MNQHFGDPKVECIRYSSTSSYSAIETSREHNGCFIANCVLHSYYKWCGPCKSVAAAGKKDADTVMRMMRETPINDFMTVNGRLREDGRVVRDMYLFQVKTPAESKYAFDYYKLLDTVPGVKAFRPLEESECPLIKSKLGKAVVQ